MARCLIDAMNSLRHDQVVIAGLEVELEDLQSAAGYVLDMVQPEANPARLTSLTD
jgi:hypothetical protein